MCGLAPNLRWFIRIGLRIFRIWYLSWRIASNIKDFLELQVYSGILKKRVATMRQPPLNQPKSIYL